MNLNPNSTFFLPPPVLCSIRELLVPLLPELPLTVPLLPRPDRPPDLPLPAFDMNFIFIGIFFHGGART